MDKHALRQKILHLEGLTNEEKSALLELLNKQKKYGLVWEEKSEEVEERMRNSLPVLREVKERAILSNTADAPNHILIEGDNLEALTTLSYTHEGKIDVIYIDPPYNTGNKDFIYNDSFVDAEDSFRHSKWLSFMSKRLKIAKRLLSDKGVIFISIDDNEQAQLKLLCDELFGARNFIDIFSWNKTETPANLSLKTKKAIEYILCYSKYRNTEKFRGLAKTSVSNNGLMNQTNIEHELVFPKNTVDTRLPNGIYKKGVYGTSSYRIELLEDVEVLNGYFITPVRLYGKFKWGQNYLDAEIKRGTQISIKTKVFSPSYEKKEYEPEVPWNLINRSFGVETNESASSELKAILGDNLFDFPKPSSLIKYLMNFINASIVLDFFAGSGTTLHATMQLNAEDGGRRQCILVTNNENNICEEVTYERNKRVINGYVTPKGEWVEGLKNNSLRYYKTEMLPRTRSPRNMRALMAAATDLLCIKENLYDECPNFGRLKADPRLLRYFVKNDRRMLILYCEELADRIVEEIKTMDFGSNKLKIYIFSPDRYAFDDNFFEVQDKVQLVALPAAIYDAYQRVLPKQPDRLLSTPTDDSPAEKETVQTSLDFDL